jgi:hypothetical protein
VPYVESDFPGFLRTAGGIGDVRVGYRWAAHDVRDPTATFQGLTLGSDLSLPTGSKMDSIGAGNTIWAPTVEGAFSFADGYVGFNPAFTYLYSSGETIARSMTSDMLFRPGIFLIALPVEMRASVLELPFHWRVSDRWMVGGGATMNYDRNRDDGTSWVGNVMVGVKISERVTWRFDYGERLAGPDPIFGRFRMQVAMFY